MDVDEGVKAGKQIIVASSLPGKIAPITAGEIIAETVLQMEAERREETHDGKD